MKSGVLHITKPVKTNIVLQFIYFRRIENMNHPNRHGTI
jgi:hypothetical protein